MRFLGSFQVKGGPDWRGDWCLIGPDCPPFKAATPESVLREVINFEQTGVFSLPILWVMAVP